MFQKRTPAKDLPLFPLANLAQPQFSVAPMVKMKEFLGPGQVAGSPLPMVVYAHEYTLSLGLYKS